MTQSYAQPGTTDTTRCYGFTELKYIASGLVKGRACDTLLSNANLKLSKCDSLNSEKDLEIDKLNTTTNIQTDIIQDRENTIDEKNSEIRKLKKIVRFIKAGWITSVGVLTGALTYSVFKSS